MMKWHTPKSSCHGFSLVEMLIAITVLSLLGLIVMQVFLSADVMNRRAETLDHAVAISAEAVERIKATSPGERLDGTTLSTLFPDSLVVPDGDGWKANTLLDADWQPYRPDDNEAPSYRMELLAGPDEETAGISTLLAVSVHEMIRDDASDSTVASFLHASGNGSDPLFSLMAEVPNACGQEETP